MKILLITQARTGSTRFPNKVLKNTILNIPLIKIHLDRLKKVKSINHIVVATTNNLQDNYLNDYITSLGYDTYRGSENNVLERFFECYKIFGGEIIIRVTSDCPLIDPELIDNMIKEFVKGDYDYLTNCANETYPDGQDIEIFKSSALLKTFQEATKEYEKEHVTIYMRENPYLFKVKHINSIKNFKDVRLTVDVPEDLTVINYLLKNLGSKATWMEYTLFYIANNLHKLNGQQIRNEGLLKSKGNE